MCRRLINPKKLVFGRRAMSDYEDVHVVFQLFEEFGALATIVHGEKPSVPIKWLKLRRENPVETYFLVMVLIFRRRRRRAAA